MQDLKTYALVMCGGKGTRLWPESTRLKPKQYMPLFEGKSLLQDTLIRFDEVTEKNQRFIVTVDEQYELAKSHAENFVGKNAMILEPSGRNTGPCILLSLAFLLEAGANVDDVVVIVPSDHVILNRKAFKNTIKYAAKKSSELQAICTIGITPNFPHTGFGYIEKGLKHHEESDLKLFQVKAFKEKPIFETAKKYVESGDYFWNAGMFVAPIKVLLSEFQEHAPDMYKSLSDLRKNIHNKKELNNTYQQIKEDSIDYAIMEKSKKVVVVPALFDWNDLGSWDALGTVLPDYQGNAMVSVNNDQSFIDKAQGNIVYAPKQQVSLSGLNDYIIVSNEKSLMIIPKSEAQKVKDIYQFIGKNKLDHLL